MKISDIALVAFGLTAVNANAAFALDDCLPGTWDADISELIRQLEAGQPAIPIQIDITDFSGSVTMSVSEDLRYKAVIEDVVITQSSGGVAAVIQMNGDNIGGIDVTNDVISLTVETFDVETIIEAGGQRTVVPPRPAGAKTETFVGTYVCTDTELNFTITMADLDPNAPAPMLPHRWTRQP